MAPTIPMRCAASTSTASCSTNTPTWTRACGRRSSGRRWPIGRAGRSSSARPRAATPSSSCGGARSRNRIGFPSCSRQAKPASFPQASLRSPSAISARTNMRRSSNAPSTPLSSVPTTAKLMARAEQDRRIAPVPYDPAALVWTSWDLGIRHATAIWFAQVIGREIRIIDYYEASGVDLGHYVRELGARPYIYAGHIVPHDAQAKELGTGKSRLEVLESLGLKNISIAPLHRVEDGINAVRVFLPKCWFDANKCARGIDALKLYRAAYDDKLQALRPQPVHDWTSHAADSFRYLALTLDRKATQTGFYRRIEYSQVGVV